MIVFVVAFQHRVPGEGVGGFDWRTTRGECEEIDADRVAESFYGRDYEHAIFEFEVPDGLSRDEVTDYIDGRYIDALAAAL